MSELVIYLCAGFFLIMGLVALAKPTFVTRLFDVPEIGGAMRNEIRAVYGGFGVAVAGALFAATIVEPIRAGILVAVATALFGMATGRIISALFERAISGYPLLFLVVELGLASALIFALYRCA